MKKYKVAFLGLKGVPAKSGADRVAESILRFLNKEFDIYVYCKKGYADYSKPIYNVNRIVIPSLKIKNFDMFIYFLLSAIHADLFGKYDLVHVHNIDGAFIIPLLSIKYKKRIVSTSHGSPYKREKWSKIIKSFFKYMERLFLYYSDFLTSVSNPLKKYYESRYNKKVYYIPNGVNVKEEISTRFINKYLKEKRIKRSYILFIAGRIIPTKGCHLLLEALREAKCSDDVLIVGDLTHSPEYAKRLKRLATISTHFLGLVESKEELMGIIKKAKLFVFPSTYEAMSMVLLEVASLGVPIIASDIAENEALFNPEEVLFFKSGDFHDLAEKIKWAIRNYKKMQEKAKLAKLNVRKRYQWQRIAEQYANIYRRMLSRF